MQDSQITSLEQMSTEQLDRLLNRELERETPDGTLIRAILAVLWEREQNLPVELTPAVRQAWETFRRESSGGKAPGKRRLLRRILPILSAAAVLCLLILAVPRQAQARMLFGKLAHLTDSIVEFFSPGTANDNAADYVFSSEDPGLQQVYRAVTGLGVTDPVVPMWLPEGYELAECKTDETTHKKSILANFRNDSSAVLLKYDIYTTDISHEYHWDGESITPYECAGITHSVMRNNDRWVVLWLTETTECSLTLDCPKETLYRILDSIYGMENEG